MRTKPVGVFLIEVSLDVDDDLLLGVEFNGHGLAEAGVSEEDCTDYLVAATRASKILRTLCSSVTEQDIEEEFPLEGSLPDA